MKDQFKDSAEDRAGNSWQLLQSLYKEHSAAFKAHADNSSDVKLSRNEMIGRIQELREVRRDLMKECGECDDAWLLPDELTQLVAMEKDIKNIKHTYAITDKDLDSVELPYQKSTGLRMYRPQFPPRIDL